MSPSLGIVYCTRKENFSRSLGSGKRSRRGEWGRGAVTDKIVVRTAFEGNRGCIARSKKNTRHRAYMDSAEEEESKRAGVGVGDAQGGFCVSNSTQSNALV